MTRRMRELLKKDVAYVWVQELEEDFNRVKTAMTEQLSVHPFDPKLPLELLTDASKLFGLGFMLLQRKEGESVRIIQCGSFSLTAAQKNYAVIELEMLAIVEAVRKCDFYLRGCHWFLVVTDHKPLEGVFKKPLTEINNDRLLRFKEALMPYNFTVTWRAGKTHEIADALSRAPVFGPPEFDVSHNSLCQRVVEDPSIQLLFDAIDQEYKQRCTRLRRGEAAPAGDELKKVWTELGLLDDEAETLIVKGQQVVVPRSARREILRRLHIAHQGVNKTKQLARDLFYWPGMSNDIAELVGSCRVCQQFAASQQAEPVQQAPADRPMEQVCVDLFDFKGDTYLVAVDAFSGYPWVHRLNRTATENVTNVLDQWFAQFGRPESIKSDNGPQFRGPFGDWCKANGIRHVTSSPFHPQSNGRAEAAVKNMKKLLQKTSEERSSFLTALAEFRGMPREDGPSPNKMLFGRELRGQLPRLHASPLLPAQEEGARDRQSADEKAAVKFNAHARELPELHVGQRVVVQDPVTNEWKKTGEILQICKFHRSYVIFDGEKEIRRNRKFIRPWRPASFAEAAKQGLPVDQSSFGQDRQQADIHRRQPEEVGANSQSQIIFKL